MKTSIQNFIIEAVFTGLCLLPVVTGCKEAKTSLSQLESLDRTIASVEKYDRMRIQRISSCRERLMKATPEQMPSICNEMFSLYYAFQSDSALFYARQGIEKSREMGNESEEATATINLAKLHQVTGSYSESLSLLDSLKRSGLDGLQTAEMYSIYNTDYEALKSIATDEILKIKWQEKALLYKDSLLTIDPRSIYIICDKLQLNGQYKEALDLIKPFCDSLDQTDSDMAIASYVTARIYHSLGQIQEEKDYLIRASICDLSRANKEYMALTDLAFLLYGEGDVKRAYNYLSRALEDASFCKARLRIDQSAPIVSIVNTAWKKQNAEMMRKLFIAMAALLVMAAILLLLAILFYRQRQHLKKVNSELEKSRTMLKAANEEIHEASNIKDTYIAGLMLECIARIEKFENYRKALKKKALASEYDELRKELKSNEIAETEWKSFYQTFDTTFLSLFPNFVSEVNKLLKNEYALSENDNKGLSPEVRIYALIRLGIDSSEQIAKLLRYSRATIYSYRSRTRLKALEPATFEDKIREIASI